MNLSPEKPRDLLANADRYHEAYYRAETFGGPSLYFHRRSLDTRQSPASLSHLEYVYATLSSWGMHRMGTGGSKMRSFSAFRASIEPMQDKIARRSSLRCPGSTTLLGRSLRACNKTLRNLILGGEVA